ncbi:MAG: hypothetical protein P9X22_02890 [Candidatus Zapsychrus exili]|nr:hypothetical protein [Candidatus Zapsychrus exili]
MNINARTESIFTDISNFNRQKRIANSMHKKRFPFSIESINRMVVNPESKNKRNCIARVKFRSIANLLG